MQLYSSDQVSCICIQESSFQVEKANPSGEVKSATYIKVENPRLAKYLSAFDWFRIIPNTGCLSLLDKKSKNQHNLKYVRKSHDFISNKI